MGDTKVDQFFSMETSPFPNFRVSVHEGMVSLIEINGDIILLSYQKFDAVVEAVTDLRIKRSKAMAKLEDEGEQK